MLNVENEPSACFFSNNFGWRKEGIALEITMLLLLLLLACVCLGGLVVWAGIRRFQKVETMLANALQTATTANNEPAEPKVLFEQEISFLPNQPLTRVDINLANRQPDTINTGSLPSA